MAVPNKAPGQSSRTATIDAGPLEKKGYLSYLPGRFIGMAEVIVSKIFPAGFGWQTGANVADGFGFGDESFGLFSLAGVGDGLGVMAGHVAYFAAKKAITGTDIDMSAEVQTGFFLGSAATCSGFAWQPCVNMLTSFGLGFNGTVVGTTMICGTVFFCGLRLQRTLFRNVLEHVEEPTYQNLKADGLLSVSIGGATGAFVGCDVGYGDANFLRPIIGVEDGASTIAGTTCAGLATSVGFGATQVVQNVATPAEKSWLD